MTPPKAHAVDSFGWKWQSNWLFTVKSEYELRTKTEPGSVANIWNIIAKFKERGRRLMSTSSSCGVCDASDETIDHLFRTCPTALESGICCLGQFYGTYGSIEICVFDREKLGCTPLRSKWAAPPANWMKLNVDGARDKDENDSCGGVIRDSKGEWKIGFARAVGISSSFEAELWGVFEGLKHAWSVGARSVIVETDNGEVFKAKRKISDNFISYL
ncbi:hypothetical protein F3Y22_tig00111662pilonHSYRG00061 [Hibiscus syriacus]|uniref:RNase H type-1 domain-containing protein n=1 Tax=Hibiscus syriacus TaxID=106335 RepID=A0A6A2XHE9_HIBSY|nr:hypothetical protein F3Y22_tig00111662pilonHSYRG00061 [Hibiscus syriacus]